MHDSVVTWIFFFLRQIHIHNLCTLGFLASSIRANRCGRGSSSCCIHHLPSGNYLHQGGAITVGFTQENENLYTVESFVKAAEDVWKGYLSNAEM